MIVSAVVGNKGDLPPFAQSDAMTDRISPPLSLPIGGWPKGQPLPTRGPEADTLYHFSEEPDIAVFVPRPVKANQDSEPLIWTIDAEHAPLYYLPRDCPRAAWWALPTTTDADKERWLADTDARMIIAVESGWYERIRQCRLFVYRFASESFVSLQDHGVHLSKETLTPLSVEPVGELIERITAANVELRFTPSLWPLHRALIPTTLHWSFMRLRNAAPEANKKPDQETKEAAL